MHLLEKAHGPWASPLVVVSKGDGNFRVCADYVRVNSLTVKDAFPSPNIGEKIFLHGLLEIHGLQKLIWQSGYNQVELAEDSRDILAITTHAGLYKPTRMSFGPCNAPAHFQRSLEGLFAKLPGTRVYFDDCPTVGKKPLKSS